MKITQDVREYAAQKEIDEQAALGVGMKEKRKSSWRRVERYMRALAEEAIADSEIIDHSLRG